MQNDSSEITIQSIVSPESYERIRSYLQHTIPGGAVGSATYGAVDDALVDHFVIELWREHPDTARKLGLPDPPAGFLQSLPPDQVALRRKMGHSFSTSDEPGRERRPAALLHRQLAPSSPWRVGLRRHRADGPHQPRPQRRR